jgi:hypothetical protein
MKTNGEVEALLHAFLTSAMDEGEWSTSCHRNFTPGEITPIIHWRGGWMGLRADLDIVTKRQIPFPNKN